MSTGEVVSEHLRAHHFALSLSGSIWERLEGSVWLFRVAELFSRDFQTVLHFADVRVSNLHWHSIGWSPIKPMTQLITDRRMRD